jgi:hypothetical protein
LTRPFRWPPYPKPDPVPPPAQPKPKLLPSRWKWVLVSIYRQQQASVEINSDLRRSWFLRRTGTIHGMARLWSACTPRERLANRPSSVRLPSSGKPKTHVGWKSAACDPRQRSPGRPGLYARSQVIESKPTRSPTTQEAVTRRRKHAMRLPAILAAWGRGRGAASADRRSRVQLFPLPQLRRFIGMMVSGICGHSPQRSGPALDQCGHS